MRSCGACGRDLTDRPRAKFCGPQCRANATKRRAKGVPELLTVGEAAPVESTGCYSATLAALVDVARESSPMGTAALALARRIDTGTDSGSALASAVKQLRETLDAALDGTKVAADPLDELRRRREAKRGA